MFLWDIASDPFDRDKIRYALMPGNGISKNEVASYLEKGLSRSARNIEAAADIMKSTFNHEAYDDYMARTQEIREKLEILRNSGIYFYFMSL